jgi:hypothetical protein
MTMKYRQDDPRLDTRRDSVRRVCTLTDLAARVDADVPPNASELETSLAILKKTSPSLNLDGKDDVYKGECARILQEKIDRGEAEQIVWTYQLAHGGHVRVDGDKHSAALRLALTKSDEEHTERCRDKIRDHQRKIAQDAWKQPLCATKDRITKVH